MKARMPGNIRQRVGKGGAGADNVPAPAFERAELSECACFSTALARAFTNHRVRKATVNRPHSTRFATSLAAAAGAVAK